jgi:hypothetical protein
MLDWTASTMVRLSRREDSLFERVSSRPDHMRERIYVFFPFFVAFHLSALSTDVMSVNVRCKALGLFARCGYENGQKISLQFRFICFQL